MIMKHYDAKRKGLIHYTLGGVMLLTVALVYSGFDRLSQQPLIWVALLSPVGLLLWLYFDTGDAIVGTKLQYRCAFLRGSIDIHHIRSVRVAETMWAGVKPALATGGLIIQYNRFDELYLAPVSNDELITDLLAINPAIDVPGRQKQLQPTHQV